MLTYFIDLSFFFLTSLENWFTPGVYQDHAVIHDPVIAPRLVEDLLVSRGVNNIDINMSISLTNNLDNIQENLDAVSRLFATPFNPMNFEVNPFSIMINQSPFFTRLSENPHPNTTSTLFQLIIRDIEVIRLSNNLSNIRSLTRYSFHNFLDLGSMFLNTFSDFYDYVRPRLRRENLDPNEIHLYNNLISIFEKHERIYRPKVRYKFFEDLVQMNPDDHTMYLNLMGWLEEYVEFCEELKLFREMVPENHSYDFEEIMTKFISLSEHISNIQNEVSLVRSLFDLVDDENQE